MAGVSADLLNDDLYRNMLLNQLWQNQLSSGANIANMGGRMALGLAIGTGLGNWLGNKFWNYQQNRINSAGKDPNAPNKPPAVVPSLISGNFDLGWTPPQNPYQFKTAQEYFSDAVKRYNPNWRQQVYDSFLPVDWQKNLSPIQSVSTNPPPTYVDRPFQAGW